MQGSEVFVARLDYLEGKRFCVVLAKLDGPDVDAGNVRLRCIHGRASLERGHLAVVGDDGVQFAVPASAYGQILPNDGTDLLKDAEYYVICGVRGMEL